MVTPTFDDYIYIGLGFAFGCMFMLNRKEYKDQKTYDQVNEEVRNELALNKNLVNSLKDDVAREKSKYASLKADYDNRTRPNTTTN
jgi:hypothetical protein